MVIFILDLSKVDSATKKCGSKRSIIYPYRHLKSQNNLYITNKNNSNLYKIFLNISLEF